MARKRRSSKGKQKPAPGQRASRRGDRSRRYRSHSTLSPSATLRKKFLRPFLGRRRCTAVTLTARMVGRAPGLTGIVPPLGPDPAPPARHAGRFFPVDPGLPHVDPVKRGPIVRRRRPVFEPGASFFARCCDARRRASCERRSGGLPGPAMVALFPASGTPSPETTC
jgi:hypothetical protein